MSAVRAAVVGFGATTPLGTGAAATWDALVQGRSGVRHIRRFDASRYPVCIAAEVPSRASGPDLYAELVHEVLSEALAGVDLSAVDPARIGVFMGSEAVRPDMPELARRMLEREETSPAEVARHLPAVPTLQIAHAVGARGPLATLSTACTSSGQSVGEGLLAIRRGEADIAIVGGVDALVHPLMVTGFARLGALSTRNDEPARASRPFDLRRDGFVLGEGAGILVLASPDLAHRVGPVLGWVSGYGCSSNAWRITDSPPDGRGARAAMASALRSAGLKPADVAYINAHGTSTQQNDVSEARGIRALLGERTADTPVSSTKSMMGHLVAACGAVEAIVALQAVRARLAPPTINLDDPDPDCDIRHVPHRAVELGAGAALTNAFGFGGSNATLVLEAP